MREAFFTVTYIGYPSIQRKSRTVDSYRIFINIMTFAFDVYLFNIINTNCHLVM